MTVGELIAALQALDCPDARVLVDGCDQQGLEDPEPPRRCLAVCYDTKPKGGAFAIPRHGELDQWLGIEERAHAVPAVVLTYRAS